MVVTLVAVAGAFGVVPDGSDGPASATTSLTQPQDDRAAADGSAAATDELAADSVQSPAAATARKARRAVAAVARHGKALPKDSGSGRRVVFSEGRQRVWLVDAGGKVLRTYLASGSVYDNLDPGTYEVFSRSRHAVGVDDSGTMEYFVRFTHGDAGAAIGFHTIPVDDGRPVQTLAQLGTPLSHGCIRQKRADAIALWDFAPEGTTVVVTP